MKEETKYYLKYNEMYIFNTLRGETLTDSKSLAETMTEKQAVKIIENSSLDLELIEVWKNKLGK